MRQNAFDEQALDVVRFVDNMDNITINDCITVNVDFVEGQWFADKDVDNIVESERTAAVVSLRHPQDRWRRSSSTLGDEHHPTMMCDQSTQVNYRQIALRST